MKKVRITPIVVAVILGFTLGPSISATHALLKSDGLSLVGRGAAWGRNHHLGVIVDRVEKWKYKNPPSTQAAQTLSTVKEDSLGLYVSELTPIAPQVSPALQGEGQWNVVRQINGQPVVWVTGVRTSTTYMSITTTFMLIDVQKLHARLYSGSEVPGGNYSWKFGGHIATQDQRNLVAAVNGGFRLDHGAGGYFTEGKKLSPMKEGNATVGIDTDGKLSIGVWGSTPKFNNESLSQWSSLRQNLLPLIIDGKLNPELRNGYWGGGGGGEIYILRSAICQRSDGSVMFAISGMTDATTLARSMLLAQCQTAMQLDQNASYPRGYTYIDGVPTGIDSRMAGRNTEYFTHSLRDFFAFFEK